jgi:hypothetical protein
MVMTAGGAEEDVAVSSRVVRVVVCRCRFQVTSAKRGT